MKMTKHKNSINITPDDELLELIDKKAKDNMRTRKAQVEYIVKQYFENIEETLMLERILQSDDPKRMYFKHLEYKHDCRKTKTKQEEK